MPSSASPWNPMLSSWGVSTPPILPPRARFLGGRRGAGALYPPVAGRRTGVQKPQQAREKNAGFGSGGTGPGQRRGGASSSGWESSSRVTSAGDSAPSAATGTGLSPTAPGGSSPPFPGDSDSASARASEAGSSVGGPHPRGG